MKATIRKTGRQVKLQLDEIDYLDKLSPKEKEYILQFYREYHGADFNFKKPIHPKELRKDCNSRSNASRRQVDAVGVNPAIQAANKARDYQGVKGMGSKYYTPEDYKKKDEDDDITRD